MGNSHTKVEKKTIILIECRHVVHELKALGMLINISGDAQRYDVINCHKHEKYFKKKGSQYHGSHILKKKRTFSLSLDLMNNGFHALQVL